MSRAVREPGGALLVGAGLSPHDLHGWCAALYPHVASLSVIIDTDQQREKINADEIWAYGPLGLRGSMAFIRRISWRHFDCVYQPAGSGLPYLRHFIWPRPDWQSGQFLVDFRP